jgi:PAS domain S-box-containing protein
MMRPERTGAGFVPAPGQRERARAGGVPERPLREPARRARRPQPPAPRPLAEIDAIGLGIYSLEAEGRCTHANPAALAMLGYELGEVLGRNMHELCHHSHPDGSPFPASACPLVAARQNGRPVRLFNELLWRRDGSFFAAEIAAWPLPGGAGSVVTFQDAAAVGRGAGPAGAAGHGEPDARRDGRARGRAAAAAGGGGRGLGAQAAFFWSVSHRERRLSPEASWTAPGTGAEALVERTMAASLERGEGLAGRAWEEDELVDASPPPRARGGRRPWRPA